MSMTIGYEALRKLRATQAELRSVYGADGWPNRTLKEALDELTIFDAFTPAEFQEAANSWPPDAIREIERLKAVNKEPKP